MTSEYDPFLAPARPRFESSNLDLARGLFAEASRPYLLSPLPWLAWACILPAAAFLTASSARRFGWVGVLLLWSFAILIGGAFELGAVRRATGEMVSTPLASWAFGVQGNLSLVCIALSLLLLWVGQAWALPGLWLLLLGHSLVSLGGLAFPPMRHAGLMLCLLVSRIRASARSKNGQPGGGLQGDGQEEWRYCQGHVLDAWPIRRHCDLRGAG